MRNRKFTYLLCLALTVAVAMFGVTEAKAETIANWTVSLGTPIVDNTYVYTFDDNSIGEKISFVEILIPKDDIKAGDLSTDPNWPRANIKVLDGNDVVVAYEYLDYDGSTGFGIGDPRYDVLKIKSNNAKSFPSGVFTIKIILDNQNIPATFVLGDAPTVMLVKSGNGQVWDSSTIGGPGFVPVGPPIGVGAEFVAIEGHPNYVMQITKDVYGNLSKVCLYSNPSGVPTVELACSTGVRTDYLIPGTSPQEYITLDLGDLGETVLLCRSGTPQVPLECDYLKFSSKETEVKDGNSTCGYKFFYGRYAYICF